MSREAMITRALRLSGISVGFGLVSGSVSVITGLRNGSLSVFAVGLGVLADVTGSVVLIRRFHAERDGHGNPHEGEARAARIVAAALGVVALVLAGKSAAALASTTRPGGSAVTLASAAVSLLVLVPLAAAKRRAGREMDSRALMGDASLSGIGAATSMLALIALVLYHVLDWWWADRVAALVVAAVAAAEAWHTFPRWAAARPDAEGVTVVLVRRGTRGQRQA